MSQQIISTVTHTPILHNGERYDVGATITLTEREYLDLKYYLSDSLTDNAIADELDQQA